MDFQRRRRNLRMARRTVFVPYQPKTLVNKGKRADSLFWSRYSAYPYIGCQHGCEFCYCRERKFSPYDDPNDFAYVIKVKTNAASLLRQELRNAPADVVFTGDYQPAERKFMISRQLLDACLELGFPVFVLERSPLVLRDLDLLQAIEMRARAVAAFSIIAAPGSPAYETVCQVENLAPPAAKRLAAMEKIAAAGISTGTLAMPLLPGLCDTKVNLENLVRWTAEHGGRFVVPGLLTLSDQQGEYFLTRFRQRAPRLMELYACLYPPGSYAPQSNRWRTVALRVREYCTKYGLSDLIPRPIIPSERRRLNKRVVEILVERLHAMQLENAPENEQWHYRRAAWAIEGMEEELGLFYRLLGRRGLQSIPQVTPALAQVIENLILSFQTPTPAPTNHPL